MALLSPLRSTTRALQALPSRLARRSVSSLARVWDVEGTAPASVRAALSAAAVPSQALARQVLGRRDADGTDGACALVAPALLVLAQRYARDQGTKLPPSCVVVAPSRSLAEVVDHVYVRLGRRNDGVFACASWQGLLPDAPAALRRGLAPVLVGSGAALNRAVGAVAKDFEVRQAASTALPERLWAQVKAWRAMRRSQVFTHCHTVDLGLATALDTFLTQLVGALEGEKRLALARGLHDALQLVPPVRRGVGSAGGTAVPIMRYLAPRVDQAQLAKRWLAWAQELPAWALAAAPREQGHG